MKKGRDIPALFTGMAVHKRQGQTPCCIFSSFCGGCIKASRAQENCQSSSCVVYTGADSTGLSHRGDHRNESGWYQAKRKFSMEKIELGAGILVIKEFLSVDECLFHIRKSESAGFNEAAIQTKEGPEIFKSIRNNDRIIFDDEKLASSLFERAKPLLPSNIDDWILTGFNERFRLYRYTTDQFFKWHKDGFYCRNENEISQLSFLIYLNSGYEGGETELKWDVVKPETGMALIFPHLMMHQGTPVLSGVKYVLRTDVMYRRLL